MAGLWLVFAKKHLKNFKKHFRNLKAAFKIQLRFRQMVLSGDCWKNLFFFAK